MGGPWEPALRALESILAGNQVLVYLDAPYRRDEYSRYYHPLETLVTYSYPSSIGVGKIPDKALNERFVSEFFTRNDSQIVSVFVNVIVSILKRGWTCAWSHSDSAAASTMAVAEKVLEAAQCTLQSYATPYIHKSQGGRQQKRVTEYLLLFVPGKT